MNPSSSRSHMPAEYRLAQNRSSFGLNNGPFYLLNGESIDEHGVTRQALKLEDKHGGAPGIGHGGMTMALLDEVMGRASTLTCGSLCVTVSMNTNFCASTLVGDFLIASATISQMGRKLAFVDAKITAGEVLIATATGVWKNTGRPIPYEVE